MILCLTFENNVLLYVLHEIKDIYNVYILIILFTWNLSTRVVNLDQPKNIKVTDESRDI